MRVVVILRRFGLQNFDHISLWDNLGLTLDKQAYFCIFFYTESFRVRKFRVVFLCLRYFSSFRFRTLFFLVFKILSKFSDEHLRSFRSLIFTKNFHYGLKHLFFAFLCNPFYTTRFFVVRFFVHFYRILFFTSRKLEI